MNKIKDLSSGVPVVLANGLFPESKKVLQFLEKAKTIICCDGSVVKLLKYKIRPDYIVGDMDSLPLKYQQQFKEIIIRTDEQETNDLTKAIHHALSLGFKQLVILGATGLREDHTLGNVGLLAEHGHKLQLQILSDFGIFTPLYASSKFDSYPSQQVSIFSIMGTPLISSEGLKYPLNKMQLSNWWKGTLNEAISNSFSLNFENGGLVVFRSF